MESQICSSPCLHCSRWRRLDNKATSWFLSTRVDLGEDMEALGDVMPRTHSISRLAKGESSFLQSFFISQYLLRKKHALFGDQVARRIRGDANKWLIEHMIQPGSPSLTAILVQHYGISTSRPSHENGIVATDSHDHPRGYFHFVL